MKLIGSKLSSIRLHRTFSTSLPSSFQSLFSSTSPEASSTDGPLDSTHTDGGPKDGIIPLKSLSVSTRSEILSSIKSLQLYTTNNKKFIDQKRKLFKMMSWRQQKICIDVGYLDKLQMIDQLIVKNQQVLNEIVKFSIDKFDVKFSDFDSIKNFADNNSFKVIESLSHLNRDWDDQQEIAPILNFLHDNLSNLDINRQDTSIIVPGSGLGRIGHELALQGWKDVNSIELNGIMYLINLFIYHNSLPNLEIYPYIHNLSNFTTLKNQFRSVIIPNIPQPPNLTVNLEDFKFFEPPNSKNIIVVTVFFIDTAENLIDYIDTINSLVKPYDKKYWINIGPLKYGTAPQVELNVEELTMVREKMGWHDIHTYNSLDKGDIVGYATDKESLWQGYYGLTGWMSSKH